ncbi:MAG TPA: 3-isopropylmalate dehydratase small subunit [Candidatus Dormibacteraeota bacterium]|nr:3-isopropylmalate dehydratase small subunit [Candidatus Dormibacteraeota bacterium]
MQAFTRVTGIAAPLDRPNVDTDQIIPKQFLKRIERSGYGPFLFYDWRYRGDGVTENPDFELNRDPWRHAPVLLAGRNFGCGSSREHAAWALEDYGVRAVIAPSFSDIFRSNALKTGLLPVQLSEEVVTRWLDIAREDPGAVATVDLEQGYVEFAGERHAIELDEDARERLVGGLDDIALSLRHAGAITSYEAQRPGRLPSTSAFAR